MEGRIIEYIVVDEETAGEVSEKVTNLLGIGYELYGELKVVGVFADWGGDEGRVYFSYSQAMVLRESPDEE